MGAHTTAPLLHDCFDFLKKNRSADLSVCVSAGPTPVQPQGLGGGKKPQMRPGSGGGGGMGGPNLK